MYSNMDDDRYYDGDWQNGLRHGHGIFHQANGTTYEGQWVNDQQSGAGKLVTEVSAKFEYDGQWANGKRNGIGISIDCYEQYEGQFENNKRHGYGKVTKLGENNAEGQDQEMVQYDCGRLVPVGEMSFAIQTQVHARV
jgi:hypothetical protein